VEAVRGCRVSTPPTLGNPPLTSGPNHQSPGGGVALVAPRQGDTTRTFDILCQTDRFRRCSTARNVRIQTLKRKPMSPLVDATETLSIITTWRICRSYHCIATPDSVSTA
jgi:hypothetical protein